MKKKFIGIVLALTVAASLMACSSDSASSSSKEDSSKKASTEATESKDDSESKKDEDSQDGKANDLPVGYIADGGYYNSYFGFKFEVSADDSFTTSQDIVAPYTVVGNDLDANLDEIDTENYETVENALSGYLDSNGRACVYQTPMAVTAGDQTLEIWVSVRKTDGKSLEELIEEEKERIQNEINYLSHSEATQSSIEIGGESAECLTYVKDNESNTDGSDGTPKAIIYFIKDEYVYTINLSGYSSFENACTIFDAFE